MRRTPLDDKQKQSNTGSNTMARRAAKEVEQALVSHPIRMPQVTAIDNASRIIDAIIRAAADPNVDVVKMERLEARAAKIAYDDALAHLQAELPEIERNSAIIIRRKDPKTGDRTGPIEQKTPFAKWEDIMDVLRPILKRWNFSLSFRTGFDEAGRIKVTAILARSGHREETTMILPHDASGSKNAVQAIGSTTSYGRRYAASILLNIATRGEDDDAVSYKAPRMVSQAQLAELIRLADDAGADKARFCAMLKVDSMADIPELRFQEAKAQLLRKKKAKAAKSDFPGDGPL